MPELSKEEIVAAIKEAQREWAKDALSTFGWFSIKAIGVAALTAIIYFILTVEGWKKS
jgi:hypothetical protein